MVVLVTLVTSVACSDERPKNSDSGNGSSAAYPLFKTQTDALKKAENLDQSLIDLARQRDQLMQKQGG